MYLGFLEPRPPELCKMCGKCCRCVTAPIPYKELKKLAEENHEGAIDFLDIFEPYESFDSISEIDKPTVLNIIESIEKKSLPDEKNTVDTITFYKCKHIMDNNLCAIYQNRKNLCDVFPSSPWSVVPPGCGFENWLFEQREKVKQKIIKQKENLEIAKNLLNEATSEYQVERTKQTIANISKTIKAYEKYGAADW